MGTLFPDSPEYPDHKSVPSPAKEVIEAARDAGPVLALIGVALVTGDGPENLLRPDMRAFGQQAIVRQSTSTSDVPFFGNNSQETAAQVIRQHRERINRASMIAMTATTSTNAALWMSTRG